MIKLRIYRILSVAAAVLWMAVIFRFSAQVAAESDSMSDGLIEKIAVFLGLESDGEGLLELIAKWQFFVRKAAHFTEYAVLGFLVANAFKSFGLTRGWRLYSAPAVSFLYAVSDEVHQYFVPGRACRVLDMFIDLAGVVFGTAVFWLLVKLLRFLRNRRQKNGKKNRPQ